MKIAFMGAGGMKFTKKILGDSMLSEALRDGHYALYDIDANGLRNAKLMMDVLNENINECRATITAHLGVEERRQALEGANFVVNAIQVGGYKPATIIDFEIPKRYGLRQTIADTLGIGGIFRGLRTIPVCLDFARDMEEVCPDAWFLNYTNPMAIVTGAMLRGSGIRTVGLCHSVQNCVKKLFGYLDMEDRLSGARWKIAGINHQGWLLEIIKDGQDLYPEIKRRAATIVWEARKPGAEKHNDMVRLEMMRHFGYYVTESSEHTAEYVPYWIKSQYPQLVEEFNIPLDDLIRRYENKNAKWELLVQDLAQNAKLDHERTHEYGASVIEAIEMDVPYQMGGNVLNTGLIPNLPQRAVVEVPCLVDGNGVQGCYVGELPEQLAAINRTNINVQLLTVEAAFTGQRDAVYHAAMLDPHTASELTLDQIRSLCDELLEAHNLGHLFA
jgi:alpha-galactosidase